MRIVAVHCALVVGFVLSIAWLPVASAAPREAVPVTAINPRMAPLEHGWVFHAGDDPSWADPKLDDSAWQAIDTTRLSSLAPILSPAAWPGIGWFRLRFTIAPGLIEHHYYLQLRHAGASEAFLDGKLVRSYGTIGSATTAEVPFDPATMPPEIVFSQPGEHVLAIRYAYKQDVSAQHPILPENAEVGFFCWLQVIDAPTAPVSVVGSTRSAGAIWAAALAGVLSALGFVHALSFWFDRRRRFQLFLGAFAASVALFIALVLASTPLGTTAPLLYALPASAALGVATSSFSAFLFARIKNKAPNYLWFAPLVWVIATAVVRGRGDGRLVAVVVTIVAGALVYFLMTRVWRAASDRAEATYTRRATWAVLGAALCLLIGGAFVSVYAVFFTLAGGLTLAPLLFLTARFAYRLTTMRRNLEKKVKAYSSLTVDTASTLRPAALRRPGEVESSDASESAGEVPAEEPQDLNDEAASRSADEAPENPHERETQAGETTTPTTTTKRDGTVRRTGRARDKGRPQNSSE